MFDTFFMQVGHHGPNRWSKAEIDCGHSFCFFLSLFSERLEYAPKACQKKTNRSEQICCPIVGFQPVQLNTFESKKMQTESNISIGLESANHILLGQSAGTDRRLNPHTWAYYGCDVVRVRHILLCESYHRSLGHVHKGRTRATDLTICFNDSVLPNGELCTSVEDI